MKPKKPKNYTPTFKPLLPQQRKIQEALYWKEVIERKTGQVLKEKGEGGCNG